MRQQKAGDEMDTGALETAAAIAVDIGGTTTRVARALAPDGPTSAPTLVEASAPFPTEQDYSAQVARLGEALAAALALAWRAGVEQLAGVGVSLGGRIAQDGAEVVVAPNLRDYEGHTLVQDIAAHCGLPVRLAHDAVCGLLGERRYGALSGADRCAYLTLSTGTGCALHLAAPGGGAGVTLSIELGHQILAHNERLCLCGQVGCLETYTGGRQLGLRYGQPIETLPEAEAAEMWRVFVEKLSLGLVNLAQLTRVERVAIGGAIALRRPALLDDLRRGIADRLRNARLELAPATLGEQAPLIGAAALLSVAEQDVLH